VNTQFAQPSPFFARVRKALTGGVVALVAGALLATGMTSVASAAVAPTFKLTVTAGGVPVAGVDVEIYDTSSYANYVSSVAYGSTDETGRVTLGGDSEEGSVLKTSANYVVSVKKSGNTPDEDSQGEPTGFGAYSDGYISGNQAALVDDFAGAAPVKFAAGVNTRTVTLLQGATLSGTIFDAVGEPFANAQSATAWRKSTDISTGDVRWDREASWNNNSVAPDYESESNFTIQGLRAGEYAVGVNQYDGNYASSSFNGGATSPASAELRTVARGSSNTINVTLATAHSISGTVSVPESVTLTEDTAWISATLENSDGTRDEEVLNYPGTSVNADGTFELAGLGAGDYLLQFKTDPDSELRGEWYDNSAVIGDATAVSAGTTDLNVTLGMGFEVSGRITAGGSALAGVTVEVQSETSYQESVPTATSDANGNFSITGIAPDSYTIEYTLAGEQYPSHYYTGEAAGSDNSGDALVVAKVDGVLNADLDLPGVATIVARITDAKGAAVKGAWVEIVAVKNGGRDWDGPSAIAYAVPGKSGSYSADLPTGHTYTILTDAKGSYWQYLGGVPVGDNGTAVASAKTFEVETGVNTVDVSLYSAGAVSGTVKSTAKKALAGVRVYLYGWNGTSWERTYFAGFTDKKGAYSAINVQPGSYKVTFDTADTPSSAFVSNFNFVSEDLSAITPIYVGKGASVVANGTLVPGGSITGSITNTNGVVAKNVAIIPIKLEGQSGDWYSRVAYNAGFAFTNAKGKFTATGLPAGTYALSFTDHSAPETGLLGNTYTLDENVTYYTVTAGKVTTIPGKIELPAFGTTERATVTGSVSPAVEGIFGEVRFDSTEGLNSDYVILDGTSDFSITLAPGEYNWSSNFESSENGIEYSAQSGTIYLEEGSNTLTVVAEPKSSLSFDVSPVITLDGSAATTVAVGNELFANAEWSKGRSSYQWLRDGVPIFGATLSTYSPRGGDIGTNISVRVMLDNGFADYNGLRVSAVEYSAPVTVTVGAQIQAWSSPYIYGTSLTPGSVLVSGEGWFDIYPVSPSYEWLVDGEVVEGATSKSYVIRTSDIGLPIKSRITANRLGYQSSEPVLSVNSFTAEIGTAPTVVKNPTVKATKAGADTKYTVTPGTWSLAGTTASYVWYLDGEAIEGRTSAAETFSLLQAPAASAITVGVTASKQFYAQSEETVVVARKGTAPTTGEAGVTNDGESVDGLSKVIVGDVLTVNGGYGAPDGSAVTLSYTWQRQAGTKWAAIAKATASTYKVALADAGKNLRVVVSVASPRYATSTAIASAGVGTLDETLTQYAEGFFAAGGTGAVSSTLTAPAVTWPVAGVKNTYQWYSNGVAIKKATKATFVVTASLVGKDLTAIVTGTKAGYSPGVVHTFAITGNTGTISALAPLKFTGGTTDDSSGEQVVKVGSKLTAKPTPVDVAGVKRAYQWSILLPTEGEEIPTLVEIPGATKTTYTVTAKDAATNGATLVLTEDISKANFETYSTGTDPILIKRIAATVKTAPKVTKSGDTYKVSAGVYAPAGGVESYGWYADGEPWDEVSGANYTPSAQLSEDALLEVRVTYQVTGYADTVTTLVARKVAAPVLSEIELDAPRALETTYADWASSSDYPLSDYSVQWYLGTTAIKGATKFEYTPTLAQVGKKLKFTVTLNSPKTTKGAITSTPKTVLAAFGAENGTAAVGGATSVGKTLTATVAEKRAGFTVSYSWMRGSFENGTSTIAGATKLSYKTTTADAGSAIWIRTTYKRTGYESTVFNSDPWFVPGSEIVNLASPTIVGSGAVDVALTASPGSWTNAPTFTYQWYRNGVAIPGATAAKFTPTSDYYGDDIHFVVVAKKTGFYSQSEYSAAIAVTKGAAATVVATPKLTGAAVTCSTFTATPGTWSLDGIEVKYQWYLIDGGSKQLIQGATESTYTAKASNAGYQLKVIVTAERAGYATGISETVTSAALAQGCEL